jgi:hypothetical protein
MINEFFAVTMTSLYHVTATSRDGSASAEKIAIKGESKLPVGTRLEHGDGRLVAIRRGLLAFIPEGGGYTSYQREPASVNTRWHEGQSSPIVALFTSKDEAAECLDNNNLEPADQRWIESTKKVLEEIGEKHPSFVISHWHGDCLLPNLINI